MANYKHPLYGTWALMIVRCTVPGAYGFPNYGGRGIKVCDRWMQSFEAFVADLGERPAGYTLDRIDPNGNYDPTNCKWSSKSEQSRNTRRARFTTIDGVRYHVSELSEKYGIPTRTLAYRISQGWNKDKLLNPARQYDTSSLPQAVLAHAKKKRAQKRCKRGHLLKGKNLYFYKGHRICRTCRRMRERGEL
jgi:hypothetical protein